MQSVEDRQAAVWSAAATVAGAILVRGGVL